MARRRRRRKYGAGSRRRSRRGAPPSSSKATKGCCTPALLPGMAASSSLPGHVHYCTCARGMPIGLHDKEGLRPRRDGSTLSCCWPGRISHGASSLASDEKDGMAKEDFNKFASIIMQQSLHDLTKGFIAGEE